MKKLMLSLDDLRVDTFTATQDGPGLRGTVKGHDTLLCPAPESDSWGETECSCSDVYETCAQMGCDLSYHTDCHRCW